MTAFVFSLTSEQLNLINTFYPALLDKIVAILRTPLQRDTKRRKLRKIGITRRDHTAVLLPKVEYHGVVVPPVVEPRTVTAVDAVSVVPALAEITPTISVENYVGDYTFGVEIECFNVNKNEVKAAAERRGLECPDDGYDHTDHTGDRFKIVSDCSICGRDGAEVVSPILRNSLGLVKLSEMCQILADVGAKVNRTCGLHVHIGAANLTDAHFANFVHNYAQIEKIIDGFMAKSRCGNNRFCKDLSDYYKTGNKQQLLRNCGSDRYRKVNLVAYDRHKTIEFRQHQGTVEFEKIRNWVLFLISLCEYSRSHEITENQFTAVNELPFLSDELKAFYTQRTTYFNRRKARLE